MKEDVKAALAKCSQLLSNDGEDFEQVKIVAVLNHFSTGYWWYITEYSEDQQVAFGYAYCHLMPDGAELGYMGIDILDRGDITVQPFTAGLTLADLYTSDRCDWCGRIIDFGADDCSWGNCDRCGANVCASCDPSAGPSGMCTKCDAEAEIEFESLPDPE